MMFFIHVLSDNIFKEGIYLLKSILFTSIKVYDIKYHFNDI